MTGVAPVRQTHLAVANLVKICEHVLGRSPISADDGLLELVPGADAAGALSRAIEKATGQSVPVAMIREAPTVRILAQELERVSPRFRALVLLKDGDGPPLFMAAGAGGSIIRFSQFARKAPLENPVYAIEMRQPGSAAQDGEGVEEIAKSVSMIVRARQPNGPYLLAGHSLGGLVMLEVAQNLTSLGERVPLLALFDTYPHPYYWRLGPWIAAMIRMSRGRLGTASRMRVRDVVPYLQRQSRNFVDHVRARRTGAELLTTLASHGYLSEEMKSVLEDDLVAWSRYRPRYYPGTITFLKAATGAGGLWPSDPIAVWGSLAKSLDIHTVPGNHLTMLTGHATELGTLLALRIERALALVPDAEG